MIGLALSLIASSACAQSRADNMKKCLSEDDPDVTIGGCTALIKSGHETADNLSLAYTKRGTALILKNMPAGPYDQAIADATKALELRPGNADALDTRALAYQWKGDHAKALLDCDKAIALQPNKAQYFMTRAHSYDELHRSNLAIADYRAVVRLAPGSPNARLAVDILKRLGASP